MAVAGRSEQRRTRELELVRATRALFDERGLQDAPIEEIARSVGIARGLIYREFSSKEELYVLTVTDYLSELAGLLDAADAGGGAATERLERVAYAYAGFCERYPAFLDCSLSLMHRPARDLRGTVSESVWFRLGRGMGHCIGVLIGVLTDGREAGEFDVAEPDYLANVLWTQTLGAMHLARLRIGMRLPAPGMPELFAVRPEQVVESCVESTFAIVRAQRPS